MTLFVNGRFLTQPMTGVQRAATEIVTAMRDDAVAMTVLVPGAAPDLAKPFLEGVAIERVGRFAGQLWEQVDLPRAASSGVLIGLGNLGPIAKGARQLVMVYDLAVFTHPQTFSWRFAAWYRFVLRALARRGASFVTDSAFSRGELESCLRVGEDRVAVAHLGAEHVLRAAPDSGVIDGAGLSSGRYVLSVGGSAARKNLANAAQGVSLTGQDLRTVSVGSADPRVLATDLMPGAGGDIVHLGRVSDGQLRALYEGAACVLFPSLHEGFGLPAVEGMACGTPVVTSRAGALPEVCGDAVEYCDPLDPNDIARAVAQAIGPRREELVVRGKERARRFTWRSCAARVVEAARRL